MTFYLPDDVLVTLLTLVSTSTDSKEDPEWYSRPTRRPLAVTYLVACERVCTQWKFCLRSRHMHNAWLVMLHRDFPGHMSPQLTPDWQYKTLFFHAYYSRAARATIHNIDVFADAASAKFDPSWRYNSSFEARFDPSWRYNVFFEARQKGGQTWPLMHIGECRWTVNHSQITLFRVTPNFAQRMHNMIYKYDFPQSRDVVLGHETEEYTNDYVPTPGLEGAVYIGRSDGRRALLGRFDSTLISEDGDERDGWTYVSDDSPHNCCAPVFAQPLMRSIFFGTKR